MLVVSRTQPQQEEVLPERDNKNADENQDPPTGCFGALILGTVVFSRCVRKSELSNAQKPWQITLSVPGSAIQGTCANITG